ncbi:MAG: fumarate hydratase C-terminal domain-containing protein [Spirochaetales bacterium]|nr:fumarate hydratase C-terminal domain-containing protein [Spirochaetales bacterium]
MQNDSPYHEKGESVPMELENQVIYCMGPAPIQDGEVIGSCGPTTSSRMDPFTPAIFAEGVKGIIGKGPRSEAVVEFLKKKKLSIFTHSAAAGPSMPKRLKRQALWLFPT